MLGEATKLNHGKCKQHYEYVTLVGENIEKHCKGLKSEKTYILGLT
ncbi:hypothetical protein UT300005_21270 [Clostridium sp. CTA-5]